MFSDLSEVRPERDERPVFLVLGYPKLQPAVSGHRSAVQPAARPLLLHKVSFIWNIYLPCLLCPGCSLRRHCWGGQQGNCNLLLSREKLVSFPAFKVSLHPNHENQSCYTVSKQTEVSMSNMPWGQSQLTWILLLSHKAAVLLLFRKYLTQGKWLKLPPFY